MFKILIHRKALKELRNLPTRDVKPIKGVKGLFRLRIGDYRIAYTVNFEKSEIAILRVGRREAFY